MTLPTPTIETCGRLGVCVSNQHEQSALVSIDRMSSEVRTIERTLNDKFEWASDFILICFDTTANTFNKILYKRMRDYRTASANTGSNN